mgnify:CR=1 FL=1
MAEFGRLSGVQFLLIAEFKYFAALRALDFAFRRRSCASPARGKGGLLEAAPLLGPLCTPPGTPPKKRFQFPSGNEGNVSPAAGASFPRYARSGDLPPRRVNARGCFHFDQYPLQPTSMNTITGSGDDLVPFQLLQDICASQT